MQAVKQALFAKAIGDTTLTGATLLGGVRISYRRVPKAAELPWVTFFKLPVRRDKAIPREESLYQFDTWSKSADLNDAIADRIEVLFDKQPLTLASGHQLQEVVRVDSRQEFYEADAEIFHTAQIFKVIVIG